MEILGLVNIPTWLLPLIAAVVLVLWYCRLKYTFFSRMGIPGPKPWPLIGNMLDVVFEDFTTLDIRYKEKFGNVVGTYIGLMPGTVVYDREIISQVTVKQFNYFMNRRSMEFGDPILSCMLSVLEDEQWKHVRSMMSPTFTSEKLRQMDAEINRCGKQLAEGVASHAGPFNIREMCENYTMDVIASTAFGLRVDSQTSNNNPFVISATKFLNALSLRNPIFILNIISPKIGKALGKYFGLNIFDKNSMKFFVDVIKQTLNSREGGDKGRNDFIQLMSNLRQGQQIHSNGDKQQMDMSGQETNKKGLTDDEIIGNAIIFFLAGFDTTTAALQMLFYNLALHPEYQQILKEEIHSILGEKEDVSYDDVSKMHYLDQCMQESLRMHSPAPRIDRTVKESIDINGIHFEKGHLVFIPCHAIHYDPEIYPEPEKYKPERFSPEGKAERNPIDWLPFGYGPRNCIGMRLAIHEMKVAVVAVLRKHKLVSCEKTEVPIQWKKGKWLKPKNGIWIAAEKKN